MVVPAHFSHIMVPDTSAKSRAQNWSTILRTQISEFYILEISWKPHDGNFLETICWEISWKQYAGKFLETICWKIWVDAGSFFDGVIMDQHKNMESDAGYGFLARVPIDGRTSRHRQRRKVLWHRSSRGWMPQSHLRRAWRGWEERAK